VEEPLHGLHERESREREGEKWWAAEIGDEKIKSSLGRQKSLVVGPAFMGGMRWQDKASDFSPSLRASESKRIRNINHETLAKEMFVKTFLER
jgi:hypothetical protein